MVDQLCVTVIGLIHLPVRNTFSGWQSICDYLIGNCWIPWGRSGNIDDVVYKLECRTRSNLEGPVSSGCDVVSYILYYLRVYYCLALFVHFYK